MADIATVVVNATDARRAARFWATALGYRPRPENPLILVPPDGTGPAIQVDETDRMHLDLRTASAEEQQAEIDRLIAAGATRVDWAYPERASFVVLADPEGNLFCVINTGPAGP